mmetsp:Transcript_36109/g.115937  ORF Transcript_36109/g.115937 Transcript_36109/m.115937 type:complete len:310 (-) Transcript_36109:2039-2968(-)
MAATPWASSSSALRTIRPQRDAPWAHQEDRMATPPSEAFFPPSSRPTGGCRSWSSSSGWLPRTSLCPAPAPRGSRRRLRFRSVPTTRSRCLLCLRMAQRSRGPSRRSASRWRKRRGTWSPLRPRRSAHPVQLRLAQPKARATALAAWGRPGLWPYLHFSARSTRRASCFTRTQRSTGSSATWRRHVTAAGGSRLSGCGRANWHPGGSWRQSAPRLCWRLSMSFGRSSLGGRAPRAAAPVWAAGCWGLWPFSRNRPICSSAASCPATTRGAASWPRGSGTGTAGSRSSLTTGSQLRPVVPLPARASTRGS